MYHRRSSQSNALLLAAGQFPSVTLREVIQSHQRDNTSATMWRYFQRAMPRIPSLGPRSHGETRVALEHHAHIAPISMKIGLWKQIELTAEIPNRAQQSANGHFVVGKTLTGC